MEEYKFTNNWFQTTAKSVWDKVVPQIKPRKILEVGSYEGASACYMVEKMASDFPIELHCIDTWAGGVEHQPGGAVESDMQSVEERFKHNIARAMKLVPQPVDLHIHKSFSDEALAKLLVDGKKNSFDFIYIDGSHQAPDVLADAVLGFKLLRVGGLMVFDDYLWSETMPYGKDPLRCPKPAIDAFVNLNFRKLQVITAPLYQLYVQKLSA